METTKNDLGKKEQFGIITKLWGVLCHNCGICSYANRRPDSQFGKLMRWHRTWCPGWASHTKIYGKKPLS